MRISCENGEGSGVSMATVRMAPSSRRFQQRAQAVQVHGFVQAVVDGFVHQRMIGNAHLAGEIFGAGRLIGKDRGHQIVGAHALDGRRHLAPARVARDGQRARSVPAPARGEHGRGQQRLREHVFHRCRLQESKTISSGKECCSPSEIRMPLSVAAACSSKLNERQKRLRSARPQARLMRAPKGA